MSCGNDVHTNKSSSVWMWKEKAKELDYNQFLQDIEFSIQTGLTIFT